MLLRKNDELQGLRGRPKRWVAELTPGWLSWNHSMRKDHERKVKTGETLVVAAMIRSLVA
jgi:hypothetical protein